MTHRLALTLSPTSFAVCRLAADAAVPSWASGPFVSVTRTEGELSVLCPEAQVPSDARCERGFRCLRVAGTLDFSMVGVLAALLAPLAEAKVSVFVVSTFDTDYVLVRDVDLGRAKDALAAEGHAIA